MMKKFIRFYFLFSLITVAFSCSDSNGNSEIPDIFMDFQLQIDIADDMLDLYEELLLQNTPEQSRVLLVENLMGIDEIRIAGISEDGTTICWEYIDRMEYCFLTETSLSDDLADRRSNISTRQSSSVSNNPIIPENNNALVLSPYQYEWSFFDFLDESNELASMLTENNYTVNFKLNDESSLGNISLEDYKQFNNYSVIAISTHGGVDSDDEVFINTGVLITEEIRSSQKDDFDNGFMGVAFSRHPFPWQRHKVIGLKSSWFNREYATKLNQTLVHIGACKGYYNQSLSNALIGNESAFFGWTGNVRADINTTNAINFFQKLFEGKTVGTAYNQVIDDGTTISGEASFIMSSNSNSDLALIPAILLEGNMDFGDVQINTSKEELLTITNLTNVEMTIDQISTPNGFSTLIPDNVVLDPQESLDLTIFFEPLSVTEYTGTVEVIYNIDQVNSTIMIRGNGVTEENQIDLLEILTTGNNWDQYNPEFNTNYQFINLDGTINSSGSTSLVPPIPLLFNEDFTITSPESNCPLATGTFTINGNTLSFSAQFNCSGGNYEEFWDWSFEGIYDEITGLFNGTGLLNQNVYWIPTGSLVREYTGVPTNMSFGE